MTRSSASSSTVIVGAEESPANPTLDTSAEAADALRDVTERRAERTGGSSSAERVRRHRARKAEEAAADTLKPSPAEVRETGFMFAFTWDLIAVPLSRGALKGLEERQALRGGEVFAPLVKKWMPMFAAWQLEMAAAMFLVSIVRECKRSPEELAAWQAEQAARKAAAEDARAAAVEDAINAAP